MLISSVRSTTSRCWMGDYMSLSAALYIVFFAAHESSKEAVCVCLVYHVGMHCMIYSTSQHGMACYWKGEG